MGLFSKICDRFFEIIAPMDEDTRLSYISAGNARNELGDYEDAIRAFDGAIKIDPEDKRPWSGKGLAFFKLDMYEDALGAFDEAIKIDPDDGELWLVKGVALQKLGRYEEALWSYDKGVEIFPDCLSSSYAKVSSENLKEDFVECINKLPNSTKSVIILEKLQSSPYLRIVDEIQVAILNKMKSGKLK